ncbi:MAG: DUF6348 family protein [Kangiellaceae bacterium]|nr:DUF6348 family protein [Kangiellaceae bacterium]MCW8999475.1 DUF6348 family protein [Kangiellaceae bacterium]
MKIIKKLFSSSKNNEDKNLLTALGFIDEHFKKLEIDTELQGSFLRVYRQPEIHITKLDIQSHDNSNSWLAHGVVEFRLNPERSDSWVIDCAIGIGETREEALKNFSENWCVFTAPAPLSLLLKEASFDAVLLAPNDSDGFPGWEGFSAPFLMRGSDERKNKIVNFLREEPVLPKLAELLEPDFPAPMLVGIRIFWGHNGDRVDARVAINDIEHPKATERLVNIMTEFAEQGEFATFGQFVLLLQKT